MARRVDYYIMPTLIRDRSETRAFNWPVQQSLYETHQKETIFVARAHRATRWHVDLRFQVGKTSFCFALAEPPSLNPSKATRARLMMDHDPRAFLYERVIEPGSPGAGPTMVGDTGPYRPVVRTYSTYELEMLHQISCGSVDLLLQGNQMGGGWELRELSSEWWEIRKAEDEFASRTQVISFERSCITGKTLDDLVRENLEAKRQRRS